MTVPGNLSSPLLATAAVAGAAAAVATKSLRFNNGDSAYLNRTPSSAGNRRTFTFSCWVKRSALGSSLMRRFFSAGATSVSSGNVTLAFYQDTLFFQIGSSSNRITSSQVFRDASAWYHIVLAVDTTQATDSNRVKIYVNGSQVTDFGTVGYPSQNTDTAANNTEQHIVGAGVDSGGTVPDGAFDGYMADAYLIDGSQLDPTSFGAYDDNGVWQAAAYSGTFGTNGFHLKFDDASSVAALGTDSSGNSNTFTVNNITLNKASVSSGTITNVAAGNAWNQSKTWSNLVSGPSQGYVSGNPITNGFDGSNSTLANASSAGGTMTFSAALGTGTFNVEMRFGNDQLYNGTTIDGVAPTSTSVANTIGHWTGLTSFNVMTMNSTGLANNARCCWNWIKVNGKFLVDSGNSGDPGGGPPDLTIANTTNFSQLAVHDLVQTNVSITAIDSSTSKISVSGGSWEGSDGTGTSGGDTAVSTVAVTTGDDVFDVPTNGDQSDTGTGGEVSGNYAVFNVLEDAASGGNAALSNGNLQIDGSSSEQFRAATIPVTSGKWYFEIIQSAGTDFGPGVWAYPLSTPSSAFHANENYRYNSNGGVYDESAKITDYSSFAVGDVIGTALDMDNGKVYFSKNGTWQNSGNPATQTNPAATGLTGQWVFGASTNGNSTTLSANFGASAFVYAAPSGFKALCTTNLPTPTVADGSEYFDTKLYTGNGGSQAITSLDFSPSLVWIKNRSSFTNQTHAWFDVLRGKQMLASSSKNSESQWHGSNSLPFRGYVDSFDSNGFSLVPNSASNKADYVNFNNTTYVSWCWDAGSSTVSNTDGTITVSQRVNQTAGFSISTYTGNATAGATFGHGLNAVPDMIIIKARDTVADGSWIVGHSGIGLGHGRLILDDTLNNNGSAGNSVAYDLWNNTAATSSVVSIGSYNAVNDSGDDYVAYCFTAVAGYSAFGSYDGNGSSDGPFLHTNHRPAWIMVKCHDTTAASGNWIIWDTTRDPSNMAEIPLRADLGDPEIASSDNYDIDILSNGFKIRTSNGGINHASRSYIFVSFAENPFSSNGGLAR